MPSSLQSPAWMPCGKSLTGREKSAYETDAAAGCASEVSSSPIQPSASRTAPRRRGAPHPREREVRVAMLSVATAAMYEASWLPDRVASSGTLLGMSAEGEQIRTTNGLLATGRLLA